nr:MAG TPA: ECF sigma factor [Caudoviricetes sp.]
MFIMRSKGETIENCAEKLNVSDSTAKRMLKRVYAKIETEQKHMTQN